jgi:hypothetical protein
MLLLIYGVITQIWLNILMWLLANKIIIDNTAQAMFCAFSGCFVRTRRIEENSPEGSFSLFHDGKGKLCFLFHYYWM